MCEAVTDHEIRKAVEDGASSVAEVMACTRAGTRCGACRHEISEIVDAAAPPPRSCRRRLEVLPDAAIATEASSGEAEAA
ncbi:MAG: (2Fe-2S)-binding protein [Polyangiaceae bacterium]